MKGGSEKNKFISFSHYEDGRDKKGLFSFLPYKGEHELGIILVILPIINKS